MTSGSSRTLRVHYAPFEPAAQEDPPAPREHHDGADRLESQLRAEPQGRLVRFEGPPDRLATVPSHCVDHERDRTPAKRLAAMRFQRVDRHVPEPLGRPDRIAERHGTFLDEYS